MIIRYEVENGYLKKLINCKSDLKRHWLARIEYDLRTLSGLRREFIKKNKTDYYVENLKIGDIVEVGAEYHVKKKGKYTVIWYGVVVDKGADFIEFISYFNRKEWMKVDFLTSNYKFLKNSTREIEKKN